MSNRTQKALAAADRQPGSVPRMQVRVACNDAATPASRELWERRSDRLAAWLLDEWRREGAARAAAVSPNNPESNPPPIP